MYHAFRRRRGFARAALILLCAGVGSAWSGSVLAFDFSSLDVFGLFGSKEEAPQPNRNSLPYAVTFEVAGEDKDLTQALRDASETYKLRQDPPPTGDALARRVDADLPHLVDALWGAGRYNARVDVTIAGAPLALGGAGIAAASRAAETYRGKAAVPIKVRAEPGPLFRLRDIRVVNAQTGAAFRPEELPQRVIALAPGDPARAADLRAAQARMIDHFRAQSRPLAKAKALSPVVDHPSAAMDVTFVLDPGPVAGIGEIAVSGTKTVDPAVVRSFIYLEPGDPYSPKALADTRKSVSEIEALGSVRIREADALDAEDGLPIFVDVTERAPRLVGFSARYSTLDGPALRTYFAHRNLFGGAERLRLEADVFLAPRINGTKIKGIDDLEPSDIGYRFSASFLKPALGGTRNDLLVDGVVARERFGNNRIGGYTSRSATATAAIRHRFTDTISVQAGVEVEKGQSSDVLGKVDYFIAGTPVSAKYDSTDSLLDPTRGIRATASVTPYPSFLGSTVSFVQSRATASTYFALDESARTVLAGRVGFGSITGADLPDIPSNRRFYAGGGGSVRGFDFRSLSPRGPFNQVIGGRSLIEGSVEARIKVTDTIGVVPFVDAGNAFLSSVPDFKTERVRVSTGLGLRYYTGIGPIRLDVAVPVDRKRGESRYGVYVSIGQAF